MNVSIANADGQNEYYSNKQRNNNFTCQSFFYLLFSQMKKKEFRNNILAILFFYLFFRYKQERKQWPDYFFALASRVFRIAGILVVNLCVRKCVWDQTAVQTVTRVHWLGTQNKFSICILNRNAEELSCSLPSPLYLTIRENNLAVTTIYFWLIN